eukprot:TRINITY_DN11828_c0_g1_i3.p1 TRINITY_DN11828_c0_g1~~TRINITY_DN11828_c0_g1_i3.p1  ORF type:complete len:598 (+),score=134.07 TRINITY_DN11828_c0_g1_i3:174-1967(+)
MAAREILESEDALFQLRHPASSEFDKATFKAKKLPNGRLVLIHVLQSKPGSLRVLPSGFVDLNGGEGKWAQFTPIYHDDGTVSFKSFGNEGKLNIAQQSDWYLGYTPGGDITGTASLGPESHFKLKPLNFFERIYVYAYRQSNTPSEEPIFMDHVDLTLEQKLSFMEQGFLHVPNVVPSSLVDQALRVINAQLLTENSMEYNELGHLVLAGGVQHSPEIKRLLYASPAYTLAQRLIGKGKVSRPGGGQIALRAPEHGRQTAMPGTSWHVDGMEKNDHSSFTLLLGVTLSDCLEDYHGNFTVFPGSHKTLAQDLEHLVHNGREPKTIMEKQHKRDFGRPVQVKARKGDIVMAHHKLAHRGGANHSPNIRYQIYFRLCHNDHEQLKVASLSDIFIEFEGLRDVTPPRRAPPTNPTMAVPFIPPLAQPLLPTPPTQPSSQTAQPASLPPSQVSPWVATAGSASTQTSSASSSSPSQSWQPSRAAASSPYPAHPTPPAQSSTAFPSRPSAHQPQGACQSSVTSQPQAPYAQHAGGHPPLAQAQATAQHRTASNGVVGARQFADSKRQLQDMGFAEDACVRALQMYQGQFQPALDALLDGRV